MAIDFEACDMYEAGDLKGALAKLRQTEGPFCAERLWMECSILASLGLHEEAVLLASEGYAVYPSCDGTLMHRVSLQERSLFWSLASLTMVEGWREICLQLRAC
jgi:hypothetical protein